MSLFLSSGTLPKVTEGTNPVVLLTVGVNQFTTQVTIVNEGTVAGDFSLDNGKVWAHLPGECTLTLPHVTNQNVLVRRANGDEGAEDLEGLYGFAV